MQNNSLPPYAIGICGDLTFHQKIQHLSLDFLESTVACALRPDEPDTSFETRLSDFLALPTPLKALNCMVPGHLKITGTEVDRAKLEAYLVTIMPRAERAGIETIVLGSGGARSVPAGFDRIKAVEQLRAFGLQAALIAADHGVTIVLEPLNRRECNVLNTVGECALLVDSVDHPNFRLLVDSYHFLNDDNITEDIIRHGHLIHHVHVATREHRLIPGAEPCDFSGFFQALRSARYRGPVSIEAKADPDALAAGIRTLQNAFTNPVEI